MGKKGMIKSIKGITLVSLVITIIVLIILAAVTINLTIGSDGIITRAKNAKENMELAAIEEQESLNQLYEQFNFEGSGTQVGDSTGQGSSSSTNISNETIRYNAQTDMVQLKDANGNWVDWKRGGLLDRYLFDGGDVCEDITGGWNYVKTSGTCSNSMSNVISISGTGVAGAHGICKYITANVIDFTGFSKLKIEYTDLYCDRAGFTNNTSKMYIKCGSTTIGTLDKNTNSSGTLVFDISEYITSSTISIETFGNDYGTSRISISKIYLTN